MIIIKNLSIAELLVDPDQGKIWINAPNCVLRCQGLEFKNKREKFSMIDINVNNAYMLEGDLAPSDIQDFIEKITRIALINNLSTDKLNKILQYTQSM